jgi:eukaryotic-like serine/threonine-protein kinase
MDPSASGRTWDDAASPAAARLAKRFEAAWRAGGGRRPDPGDFLPSDSQERPGALLALLRADLTLRWEAKERRPLEWYRQRHPDLGADALVALIYEEYCLREEAGEPLIDPAEYHNRFPEVTTKLRRVFDIHGLVGSNRSTAFGPIQPAIPFPEVGQTIGGFRLVEQLGRGSFARVFRAEERQLADRPVALKVARSGSREPQTLARLQHTNIVPVHSYRTDPVTGLHLLCMPYLGRVTLAQVLAQPATHSARTGADLLTVIDRLQPTPTSVTGRAVGRRALARRSYAQAISWWGAQMAEALQHAHDRGVLHRDVKPSNVLVTSDGVPMLLDFNLARDVIVEEQGVAPAAMGGTLAYMAPEHLEALADGTPEEIDGRADLYALGVMLFEALASRPFSVPSGGLSIRDALLRAAEERRTEVPSLRKARPETPPALEAVVRRCLAPDPADRYASAAELAADLQAVADDGPLRHAREPQPSRSFRWIRRNRRRLALAAPLVLALAVLGFLLNKAQVERLSERAEIRQWITDAKHACDKGQFDEAMVRSDSAGERANRHGYLDLYQEAHTQTKLAQQTKAIRASADNLFKDAEHLRFCLLGFGGDPGAAASKLQQELGTFSVLGSNPNWTRRAEVNEPLLDPERRSRLIEEVNELLFMWVVASDRTTGSADLETARRALAICDRALSFATPRGPWEALRARFAARLDPGARSAPQAIDPAPESSERACFQWALLSELEDRRETAVALLERASRLNPKHYWYQFYLAYLQERAGNFDQALRHYSEAIVIDPDSPWARYNRAGVFRRRGAWAQALDDLQRALATERDFEDRPRAQLDLGWVHQALGDERAARSDYERVIAQGPNTILGRAARLNRAKLDYDAGLVARAHSEYDSLLQEDPLDLSAREGRALLALRQGQAGLAEVDLSSLLAAPNRPKAEAEVGPLRVQALALRAVARLALGRPAEAVADAAEAFRREASPAHERLWQRTLLAAGQERALREDDPDELDLWPAAGPALVAELKSAAERLRSPSLDAPEAAIRHSLTRAVLLSAVGDPEALVEANRAIAWDPLSTRAYLVRARIRRRAGDLKGAWADVEQAIGVDPADPALLTLRGALETQSGKPAAGLADFDRALRRGAEGSVRRLRAQALMALGREQQALDDWSRAIAYDPEDPRAYLGRARAFFRLRRLDQALADLEQAAGWAGEHRRLLFPITLAYAACLPERPDRWQRVLSLSRRTWLASTQTLPSSAPATPPQPGRIASEAGP